MPITPFHFGLGAALHAAAPRRVSFLAFCAANVLIDVESLVNLLQHRHPVHAFFHTYVGATLMAAATLLLFLALRALVRRASLTGWWVRWQDLTPKAVAAGALLGAWTHVLLDSVMHGDIRPLAPFSDANALQGVIPLGTLHLGLMVLGAAGLAGVVLRWGWRRLGRGGASLR